MRVWIDGLQAGNRSGTGRYTMELIRALLASDSGLRLAVAWPKQIGKTPRAIGSMVPP